MKINVEGISPRNKEEVIKVVEAISTLNPRYLPEETSLPTTLVFEVEVGEVDKCLQVIKAAIKSSDIGRILMFRVIPNGELSHFR